MHPEAYDWVAKWATVAPITVLDIGGRDINGTCRPLFPNATYTALDLVEGPGVDIVADATTWRGGTFDLVVCAEVFEHLELWRDIVITAWHATGPGGRFIATCAGPGRAPHSAHDGGQVRDGEWYRNVTLAELEDALLRAGFADVEVDQLGADVRATGTRT